jgi:DNA-binding NtrC family response regulator
MAQTTRVLESGAIEAGPREKRAVLIVYHRDGAEMIPLVADAPVVIGREPPAPFPAFEDASISRQHAAFHLQGDEVVVEDLGSTNGTWIGGERVDRAVLHGGGEVAIGNLVVTLTLREGGGAPGLFGHDRFRAVIEDEILRARFFRRSLSLVFVRALDKLPVRRFLELVRPRLRVVDRVAFYSDSTLELLLPEMNGEQALEATLPMVMDRREPRLACGVATFPGAVSSADELVEAAIHSLQRALTAPKEARVGRRVEIAPSEADRALTASAGAPVATSDAMKRLFESADRVARSSAPVLLLGETGSGKEVLARYLHDGSRRESPLIAVNCGAIPMNLVESTLFGHEKGAFTGAVAQRQGVFEAATTGTVFLDEIGELPAAAQAALLRVIETRRIMRVGSTKDIEVGARIVAATHRDLEAMASSGAFRSDLLYRLNALSLAVPPLRDRREDIAPLAQRFVRAASEANGCEARELDADALELLRRYAWPGNVRELRNAIERAVLIARGSTITVDDLPERVRACEAPPAGPSAGAATGMAGEDFRTRIDRAECDILIEALRECDWNQSECARRLRMPLRTLVYKIKVHGIRKLGYGANPEMPSRKSRT